MSTGKSPDGYGCWWCQASISQRGKSHPIQRFVCLFGPPIPFNSIPPVPDHPHKQINPHQIGALVTHKTTRRRDVSCELKKLQSAIAQLQVQLHSVQRLLCVNQALKLTQIAGTSDGPRAINMKLAGKSPRKKRRRTRTQWKIMQTERGNITQVTRAHTYIHTNIYICTFIYMYVCTYLYINVHWSSLQRPLFEILYIYLYICTYI